MVHDLLPLLAADPHNPDINFSLGREYEQIGQFATAVSFYLNAAEYGYKTHPEVVYSSLVRISECLNIQGDRYHTALSTLHQAISYKPDLPDAYFMLARLYEQNQKWTECYSSACIGLTFSDKGRLNKLEDLYPGEYGLLFEKAVSAWWVGRQEESKQIFVDLITSHMVDINHRVAIFQNLERLGVNLNDGVNPLEPVVTNYRKYFGADAHVIFDIGTRDGEDAEWLCHRLNGASVFAIDADADAVAKTKDKYPWMTVIHSAVSDYSGTTSFQKVNSTDKNLAGCSSIYADKLVDKREFFGLVEAIEVPVARMDELILSYGLSGKIIDVVKIDVEGYSWQVLQGFGERLRHVKLFHIETEKQSTHEHHRNSIEIRRFMDDNGFVLVDQSYEWGPGIEDQIWVNPRFAYKNNAGLVS